MLVKTQRDDPSLQRKVIGKKCRQYPTYLLLKQSKHKRTSRSGSSCLTDLDESPEHRQANEEEEDDDDIFSSKYQSGADAEGSEYSELIIATEQAQNAI